MEREVVPNSKQNGFRKLYGGPTKHYDYSLLVAVFQHAIVVLTRHPRK